MGVTLSEKVRTLSEHTHLFTNESSTNIGTGDWRNGRGCKQRAHMYKHMHTRTYAHPQLTHPRNLCLQGWKADGLGSKTTKQGGEREESPLVRTSLI